MISVRYVTQWVAVLPIGYWGAKVQPLNRWSTEDLQINTMCAMQSGHDNAAASCGRHWLKQGDAMPFRFRWYALSLSICISMQLWEFSKSHTSPGSQKVIDYSRVDEILSECCNLSSLIIYAYDICLNGRNRRECGYTFPYHCRRHFQKVELCRELDQTKVMKVIGTGSQANHGHRDEPIHVTLRGTVTEEVRELK
jgi:hypothetical protein